MTNKKALHFWNTFVSVNYAGWGQRACSKLSKPYCAQQIMAGTSGIYKELRRILEEKNGKSYSLEGTKEIGDGLMDFLRLSLKLSQPRFRLDAIDIYEICVNILS